MKIHCPKCGTPLVYMLLSMDIIQYGRCENCKVEYRVIVEEIKKGQ